MKDASQEATRAHAIASGVFTFVWLSIFMWAGRLLGGLLPMWFVLAGAVAAVSLGLIGLHPGYVYFEIRSPECWVRLCRKAGIVMVRRWMVHGDRMNAAIRVRTPGYRILRGDVETIKAYVSRTHDMERIHLACLLASLVIFILLIIASTWIFAWSLLVLTMATNVVPIVLQRFNRARCQMVLRRRSEALPD